MPCPYSEASREPYVSIHRIISHSSLWLPRANHIIVPEEGVGAGLMEQEMSFTSSHLYLSLFSATALFVAKYLCQYLMGENHILSLYFQKYNAFSVYLLYWIKSNPGVYDSHQSSRSIQVGMVWKIFGFIFGPLRFSIFKRNRENLAGFQNFPDISWEGNAKRDTILCKSFNLFKMKAIVHKDQMESYSFFVLFLPANNVHQ